ncbi:MAG: cell division protein FtsB [Gammaproteobacteria bacterium]
MRVVLAVLIALLVLLQYQLWLADDGYRGVWRLEEALQDQAAENAALSERNRALSAEVEDLKSGLDAVEEIARSELGMIRRGETLFQVADPVPETDGGDSRP